MTNEGGDVRRRDLLKGALTAAVLGHTRSAVHGQSLRQERSFDAVFIGAGINSLAGAFLLGKAGWNA